MRCFIAVPIPLAVRKSVCEFIKKLRSNCEGVRWVGEKNLHITLRFLGDVEENMIEKIKILITKQSEKCHAFEAELKSTGCFPSPRRARVIWIGIEKGKNDLLQLFKELEEALIKLGFPKEKPFHPHITIGRLRKPRPIKLPLYRDGLFKVDEIILFKSTLTPEGPIYTSLLTSKLRV